MSDSLPKTLSVISKSLGTIYFEPATSTPEELELGRLVICPFRLPKECVDAIVEWAAGSQAPIFCQESDIPKMETHGFGAYRFHGIAGYKEIGFHGGAIEFYPAKRAKTPGWKGFLTECLEVAGLLKAVGYHVLIRPRNERPLLYLASDQMDPVEWKVITKSKPSNIVGSPAVATSAWESLAKKVGVKIIPSSGISTLCMDPILSQVIRPAKEDLSESSWNEAIATVS